MSEYRQIANLKGEQGDQGSPGIGFRQIISEPTEINQFRSNDHIGFYVARPSNLVGGPDVNSGDPLSIFEVARGANNAVLHRLTTPREAFWRNASSGTNWNAWRKVRDNWTTFIEEPVDINEYRTASDVGSYAGRPSNLIGAPDTDGDPISFFEVSFAAGNVVMQWLVTPREAFWRNASSGTAWGEWNKVGEGGGVPVSDIAYDDDGAPYITEGAGSNPQPPSRRLVTEESFENLVDDRIHSVSVRRIVTSTDPEAPTVEGDLLLVYEGGE